MSACWCFGSLVCMNLFCDSDDGCKWYHHNKMVTPIFAFLGYLTLPERTAMVTMGISRRGVVSDLVHVFGSRPPADRQCTTGCSSYSRNVGSTATRGVRGTAGAPPPCLTPSPAWWAKTMVGRYTHTQIPAATISCIYIGIWIHLSYIRQQLFTICLLLLWIQKCYSLYLTSFNSFTFSVFPTCKIPKPY